MKKSSDDEIKGDPITGFECEQVKRYVPIDLQSKVTILLQDSGYVTIIPRDLSRTDWRRLNEAINKIGGIWVSNDRFSHWSIPFP